MLPVWCRTLRESPAAVLGDSGQPGLGDPSVPRIRRMLQAGGPGKLELPASTIRLAARPERTLAPTRRSSVALQANGPTPPRRFPLRLEGCPMRGAGGGRMRVPTRWTREPAQTEEPGPAYRPGPPHPLETSCGLCLSVLSRLHSRQLLEARSAPQDPLEPASRKAKRPRQCTSEVVLGHTIAAIGRANITGVCHQRNRLQGLSVQGPSSIPRCQTSRLPGFRPLLSRRNRTHVVARPVLLKPRPEPPWIGPLAPPAARTRRVDLDAQSWS